MFIVYIKKGMRICIWLSYFDYELNEMTIRSYGCKRVGLSPSPTMLELGSLCFYEARARIGSSLLI
ncbi:hypothetical protein HanRHA438_Chr15g0683731 [Helianthus annuus]|nr:hypothetical protein HanPSC8_Chr15g0644621 [Helianthus annuus]KAJ0842727.1 hypothetical protein HanRHA438_Chr15g0683731 [Helianthus annuus]